MSVGEENWQMTRPTIKERPKFVFNNDRLSDIKFVVRKMDGESESKQVIPAHKFVLSISSPVFESMCVLTKEEIVSLVRHLTSVSTSGFSETTRSGFNGAIQRCYRFNSPLVNGWSYSDHPDVIDFTTDKDIALCGVRFFGQKDSN